MLSGDLIKSQPVAAERDFSGILLLLVIVATALAAACLGISNEKPARATHSPKDTTTTSASHELTDTTSNAANNKEVAERSLENGSLIGQRRLDETTRELAVSISNSFNNAEQNLANHPDTTGDVETSDKLGEGTVRAVISIPTNLGTFNTGELSSGDKIGGVLASIERNTDGSGKLTVTSNEGVLVSNENGTSIEDVDYSVQFSITPEALSAAAADGKFNREDIENSLADEETAISSVSVSKTSNKEGGLCTETTYVTLNSLGDASETSAIRVSYGPNGAYDTGKDQEGRNVFFETAQRIEDSLDRQSES
mgnify:CR=1 FL=1